ncbi:MAG: GNAT family N-acetyltransferase [Roseivirga sp.]|nr:GNAT family N-acetyltransferase [Roseivirga sp.]
MIQFVQATNVDIPVILEFMEAFYAIDDYPFDGVTANENIQTFVQEEHLGRLWLLKSGAETVGYLALTFRFSFEYGGRDAFIDEFYLGKSHRNKGFGTTILKQLSLEAKALDIKALHLEVETHNEIGNKIYGKAGFKVNGRTLMTKKL